MNEALSAVSTVSFEFDKAELRVEDRELLSRIAGILMTSKDYAISVNGHTDDVGSEEYNQKLSERRAKAVVDYLKERAKPVKGHETIAQVATISANNDAVIGGLIADTYRSVGMQNGVVTVSRSQTTKANIPLNRLGASLPQACQDLRTTSVSLVEKKR